MEANRPCVAVTIWSEYLTQSVPYAARQTEKQPSRGICSRPASAGGAGHLFTTCCWWLVSEGSDQITAEPSRAPSPAAAVAVVRGNAGDERRPGTSNTAAAGPVPFVELRCVCVSTPTPPRAAFVCFHSKCPAAAVVVHLHLHLHPGGGRESSTQCTATASMPGGLLRCGCSVVRSYPLRTSAEAEPRGSCSAHYYLYVLENRFWIWFTFRNPFLEVDRILRILKTILYF